MPTYRSTFEVSASPERVWNVLSSLDEYSDWNPQITLASGQLTEGAKISLRLDLPGRPALDLTATIEQARPGSLLTWRGHVVAPWFFEGYRKFEITPIDEGRVRVTHVEDIHGLIAPLFGLMMGAPVQASQAALNDALKGRAEGSS